MNTLTRIRTALAALAVAAMVTSCAATASPPATPTEPPRTATPTPTSSPTPTKQEIIGQRAAAFFIEWQALAADPNRPVGDLGQYGRGRALEEYIKGLKQMRANKHRVVGPPVRVYNVQVGTTGTGDDGRPRIPVSLCLDVTGVDQLDASGKSVKVSDRPDAFSKDVWLEEWPDGWFVSGEADGNDPC